MSGKGAASKLAASEADAPYSRREARRTGVHIALVVLGVVMFATTYAGAQYLLARHAVVGFMKTKWDAVITDVHIEELHLTDQWSIEAVWAFSWNGDPDNGLSTETAWLGLGWTKIPELPGWDSL